MENTRMTWVKLEAKKIRLCAKWQVLIVKVVESNHNIGTEVVDVILNSIYFILIWHLFYKVLPR